MESSLRSRLLPSRSRSRSPRRSPSSQASQSVDDLPYRGPVLRGALWHPRRGPRFARVVRGLQFLLHRADLHLHRRAAPGTVRTPHFSCRRRAYWIADRAHSRSKGNGDRERRGYPVALRLFAQAVRRIQARRRPMGGCGAFARDIRRPHRAPGRGRRRTANSRRLAARCAARRRRSRRSELGAAEKEPAGWGTGTLPRIAYQFRPVARRARGDCGLRVRAPFRGSADHRGGRAGADRDPRSDRDCARPGAARARGGKCGDDAGKREGAGRTARFALARSAHAACPRSLARRVRCARLATR